MRAGWTGRSGSKAAREEWRRTAPAVMLTIYLAGNWKIQNKSGFLAPVQINKLTLQSSTMVQVYTTVQINCIAAIPASPWG